MVNIGIGFSTTLQVQSKYGICVAANSAQLKIIIDQIINDEKLYGVSINVPEMINYLAFLMYNAIIPTIETNFNSSWVITDWLTSTEIETINYYLNLNNLNPNGIFN